MRTTQTIATVFIVAALLVGFASAFGLAGLGFGAPTIEDRASVHAPVLGEIVFDAADGNFYGWTGAEWVNLSTAGSSVPAGTILPFGGEDLPSGFLLCDGTAKLTSDFPALFAAIGFAFGGDGTTTFNVPDLRGRFLRGVDQGAGRDPDVGTRTTMNPGGNTGDAVGSTQGHAYESHQHDHNPGEVLGDFAQDPKFHLMFKDAAGTQKTEYSGGNETRPTNAYVHFIIKT